MLTAEVGIQPSTDANIAVSLRLSLMLLGLMACLPFIQPIHHHPLTTFYEEWMALLLGILAVIAAIEGLSARLPLPSIVQIPALLLAAVAIQWGLGQITIGILGFFYAGYMLWAIALACLGATLAERLGRARLFQVVALAIVVGALANAMVAFAQRWNTPLPDALFPSYAGKVVANLGQRNLLTTYLWMGIASLLLLREQSKLRPTMALIGVLILGAAAGLTGSRTAYLQGFALLALSFLLPRRADGDSAPARRWLYVLLGLAAVYAASEASRLLPIYSSALRAYYRIDAEMISGEARIDVWRDTLALILAQPWIGNGVGNYPWRMFEAAAAAPQGVATFPGAEHSHNFQLQLAVDFGLPVLALVIYLGARWLFRLPWKQVESSAAWGIAIVALLALHSQLEYPLWHAEFLGPCALVLGALDPRLTHVQRVPRRVVQITFAAAALLLIPLMLDYRKLDEALYAPTAGRSVPSGQTATLKDLAQHSMLSTYANAILAIGIDPDKRFVAEQSAICERAMRILPDAVLVTRCAILRQLAGRDAEARELLSAARRAYRDERRHVAILKTLYFSSKKNPEIRSFGITE